MTSDYSAASPAGFACDLRCMRLIARFSSQKTQRESLWDWRRLQLSVQYLSAQHFIVFASAFRVLPKRTTGRSRIKSRRVPVSIGQRQVIEFDEILVGNI